MSLVMIYQIIQPFLYARCRTKVSIVLLLNFSLCFRSESVHTVIDFVGHILALEIAK